MTLFDNGDGSYMAEGNKYYIGNGNCAALVSVFAKMDETNEYVFFAVESDHPKYECVQKIDTSGVRQAFVSEFALQGYPITDEDILSRGPAAWDSALSTVNVGKYELGMASVGMATHCFYEALNHAGNRMLYGRYVTDFPHVKRIFTESYCRLTAMKPVRHEGRGLHACRLGNGSPVSAVQSHRENESHWPGRKNHIHAARNHCRPGVRAEGNLF